MKFALIALLTLIVSSPSFAAGPQEQKPMPHPLTLTDQDGAKRTFDNLKGEKGLILVFYRSADWCPFCQKQLIELTARHDEISQTGYNIAGVSYDSVEVLDKFSEKRGIPFPLLSDKGSKAIRAFDLLNDKFAEGHFAYGVPHPAIVIIDNDQVVQSVLREDGYKNRVTIDDIIEATK